MVDAKIVALALVVGACIAGGLAFYDSSEDGAAPTENGATDEQTKEQLNEILEFGKERGAAMFASLTEACTDDDTFMPSSDLDAFCDEIDGATTTDDLYISCPADTTTCISFSDFFSKIGCKWRMMSALLMLPRVLRSACSSPPAPLRHALAVELAVCSDPPLLSL